MTLEQKEDTTERTEGVSATEQPKQVSVVTTEVSGEKATPVIDEAEITRRVAEAEKGWQSRKDKELQPLKQRISELEKLTREKELALTEKRELEEVGDTPELRSFQSNRRRFQEEQSAFEEKRQATETLAARISEQAKVLQAIQLAKEHGVDDKELLKADTPEAMESLAIKLENQKLKGELAGKSKTQKVDSGVVSIAGEDWHTLPTNEKIRRGLDKLK